MKTIVYGIVAIVAFLLVATLLFSGCSTGIKYTYENGVLISKSPYLEFGQMQTKEDYASLDVLKGTGFDAKIPIPLASTAGFGTLDVALGYFSHVRMLLKPTADGELPVIVIDSGVNPFNKSGVTDTVLTGKEAVKEFYLEEARD